MLEIPGGHPRVSSILSMYVSFGLLTLENNELFIPMIEISSGTEIPLS